MTNGRCISCLYQHLLETYCQVFAVEQFQNMHKIFMDIGLYNFSCEHLAISVTIKMAAL